MRFSVAMIDYKTAISRVISNTPVLPSETVRVIDAVGRFSAENIRSKTYLPEFDNSAMDGFAVSHRYTARASTSKPLLLRITGEIRAGDNPDKIRVSGLSAAKIFTGAPLPAGANAVIKVEDTETVKSAGVVFVRIHAPARRWQNVRFRGETVKPGAVMIEKHKLLRPQEIGLLIQAGIRKIKTGGRPAVGVLATGDEIVPPGGRLLPGKIRNVNSYTLAGEVALAGGIPINFGIARDNLPDMRKKILKGLRESDAFLVSAGVSVGEHDYVKKVFSEYGVREKFWKVAQRPGEPLFFGKWGHIPVFGLPGNTVSSMICFREYVKPAILKMQGAADYLPSEITARLEEPIKVKHGRRYFLRGTCRIENGNYFVRTTGEQGSGILKSMTDANCIIVIPEDISALDAGRRVKIQII